jgi:hypothetical protein
LKKSFILFLGYIFNNQLVNVCMDITFIANFSDSTETPLVLSEPRQVNYSIVAYDSLNNLTAITGSVTAPAGVSTYIFDVPLPPGTEYAEGTLLAGDFQTFSCNLN